MLAISFDLDWLAVQAAHPTSGHEAYRDIAASVGRFGFERIQQSVYLCPSDDLANLASAMEELKSFPWLPASVKDIRAFRVEQWSDFTPFMKRNAP